MAAKRKAKGRKKRPAPSKNFTAAKQGVEVERKKLEQMQAAYDQQLARVGQFEAGSEKEARARGFLDDFAQKLARQQQNVSDAMTRFSAESKQYGNMLENKGFSQAAQNVLGRANKINTRATNLGTTAQNELFKLGTRGPAEEITNITGGGVTGLTNVVNRGIEGAGQAGQGITQMNLGELNTLLMGGGGQKGLLDLMGRAQRQIQRTTAQGQRQQLRDIQGNVVQTREALQKLSPEAARATQLFGTAATRAERLAKPTNAMSRQALQQQSALARQAMNRAQNYVDPTRGLANQAIGGYQGLAGLQQRAAEDAYARAKQLNPEQMREADQAARESFAARGMLGSTGSVASEILNRESSLAARRAEAASMGQLAQQGQQGLVGLASGYESDRLGRQQQMRAQAMGLSQAALGAQQSVRGEARQARGDLYDTAQFYTTYGLPLLTGMTTAQQSSLGLLSQGLGMTGQGSGLLEAGVNLGMSKYATDAERDAAFKAAGASKSAGQMGFLGSLIGGGAGLLGSLF